jgi:hypothetical protein
LATGFRGSRLSVNHDELRYPLFITASEVRFIYILFFYCHVHPEMLFLIDFIRKKNPVIKFELIFFFRSQQRFNGNHVNRSKIDFICDARAFFAAGRMAYS